MNYRPGTLIFLCLFLPATLLAVGCGPAAPAGTGLLQDAYAAYNTKDNDAAIQKTTQYIAQHQGSPRLAEAYLIRGMARFDKGDLARAELDLQTTMDRTAQAKLRADALFGLGEIAYRKEFYEVAEIRFNTALKEIPRGQSPADQVHWRLGRIYLAMGRFEQADIQFDHILELFPESPQAPGAQQLLGAKAWTVHVGIYATAAKARTEAAELIKQGLPAFDQAYLHEGKLRYAVLVGRYPNLAAARKMLVRVKVHVPDAYTTIDKARKD